MSCTNTPGSGVNICELLFVAFLVLKLCDKIDWSWWWITAPIWGTLVLAFIVEFCKEWRRRSKAEKDHCDSPLMRRFEEAQARREESIRKQD